MDSTRTSRSFSAARPSAPASSGPPASESPPGIEALRRELERLRVLASTNRSVLKAILEHSPHGIIVCDEEGRLVLQSRASERIWAGSATADSVADWRAYRAFHPDGRPFEAGDWAMARCLAQKVVIEAEEFHIQRFDGTHGYLLGSSAPLLGPDGELEGGISVFADITRLKESEAEARRARDALERQQRRHAVLSRAAEALSSTLDSRKALGELARMVVPTLADWCAIDELGPDGEVRRLAVEHKDPAKVTLARELAEKYPDDPSAPRGVHAVLRTGEMEWMADIPDELLVAGARDEEHLAIARALRLTSYAIVPIMARGRILGALTLVSEGERRLLEDDLRFAEDLSRRAALALENARLYEAAEAARAHLHGLFMQAPAAISIGRGPEHRFELANEPYKRLMGRHDLVGKTLREALPELEGQHLSDVVQHVFSTGEARSEAELPVRIRGEDPPGESMRYFNVVVQPTRTPAGAVDGVATFAFDVTEQVVARERALALAESLAAKNRELDQFAYVTSHDLKAPLRGISSLAEWLEEDLGEALTPDAREKLELLRGRVRRMEALIQGILDFSRAGRVVGKREQIDVGKLVGEVIELLAPKPPAVVRIEGPMPALNAERVALQQIFMNLVGNALKHAGRPDAEVVVRARDAGDFWELRVADDGPGIAPEFHDRIWGIFQTLEARDRVESTGIGLAIVKKIVEGRGGRAWVESARGKGATFCFTWPKRDDRRA